MSGAEGVRAGDPYVGPVAFRAGDQLYGRDRERRALLDLLIAERIVLLYSPSGAGKTSLIEAAMVPALRENEFEVLPTIRVGHVFEPAPGQPVPRNRYVMSVLLSLEASLPPDRQRPIQELAALSLPEYVDESVDRDGRPGNEVLIFDQFEEVLTADPTDGPAKREFFKQLGRVLHDPDRWALFSMREDFLAGLDPYLRYLPTHLRTTLRLDLLSIPAALEAIRRPAERAGVDFTEEAARRLVDDLRMMRVPQPGGMREVPGSYVEPVQLQVACHLLWSRLPSGATEITVSDVEALGQVDEALAQYYAGCVREVSAATAIPERVVREWFQDHLITPSGLRTQVLEGPASSTEAGHRALTMLLDAHLVRAETRLQATWYELAHDRLIDPVREDNAEWRRENTTFLEQAAALWEEQDRADRLLLVGANLAAAEADEAVRAGSVPPREREFLDASRRAEERAAGERRSAQALARSARRLKIAAVVMGVLLITSIVFGALSIWSSGEAREQEVLARELLTAQENLGTNDLLAMELAAEAAGTDPPYPNHMLRVLDQVAQSPVRRVFRGQAGPWATAALTENGLFVVTAGSEDVRVWDRADGRTLHRLVLGADEVVTSLDVSEDLGAVVIGLADGEVIAWMPGSDETSRWKDPSLGVWQLDLSSEGKVAVVGYDDAVRVWSLDGTLEHTFVGPGSELAYAAMFSADGRLLVTSSDTSEIVVWDVDAGAPVTSVALADGGPIWDVRFGEDDDTVATLTERAVTVWSLASGQPVHPPFSAEDSPYYPYEFSYNPSSDLTHLIEVDPVGVLTVFDLETGAMTAKAEVPGVDIWGAALDVETDEALVLANNALPSIWRMEARYDLGGGIEARATAVVEGGGDVFTAWDDQFIRRMPAQGDTTFGQPVADVGASIQTLGASADGARLIGLTDDPDQTAQRASGTWSVRVWDSGTGAELVRLGGDGFTAAALTPDGSSMFLAGADGRVSRWVVGDPAIRAQDVYFPDEPLEVESIDVSLDGSAILLTFEQLEGFQQPPEVDAVIVPTGDAGQPVELTLPDDSAIVTARAFTADGAYVVLGTSEGRIVTFETATGILVDEAPAHRGAVAEVIPGGPDGLVVSMGDPSATGFSRGVREVAVVDPNRRSVRRTIVSADALVWANLTEDGTGMVLFAVNGPVRTVPLDDDDLGALIRDRRIMRDEERARFLGPGARD